MKKTIAVLLFLTAGLVWVSAEKVLYIYDEVNENSAPYITLFRSELASAGFTVDEAAAGEMSGKNLNSYDYILIHGMVMAFTSSSPIRDWLKTNPQIEGKKVSLLITANRWFLDKLYKQITDLVKPLNPVIIDSVSSATKKLTDAEKETMVKRQVSRLK